MNNNRTNSNEHRDLFKDYQCPIQSQEGQNLVSHQGTKDTKKSKFAKTFLTESRRDTEKTMSCFLIFGFKVFWP